MFSFNQQSAIDTSFATSSDSAPQLWVAQATGISNSAWPSCNHQTQNWTQQTSFQVPSFQNQGYLACQHQQNELYQNSFYNQTPNQMQMNQAPVYQSPFFHPTLNQYLKPHAPITSSKPHHSHHARINLVPNSSGGFKAIVKRKRKRTMFTTEQVEALENIFQTKPYVTREDRQIIVHQLRLSDTSVKVWFQNRRLRGKKAAEEAAEEAAEQALYETHIPSEESLYSGDSTSTNQELSESSSSPVQMLRLDNLESKLSQKVDANGYIMLDEKSINDIVSVIDSALSPDINLKLDSPSKSSDDVNVISTASDVKEYVHDSDGSTYSGSIYEPISPAASDCTEEQTPTRRWKPFAADESLQRLFDLHFC